MQSAVLCIQLNEIFCRLRRTNYYAHAKYVTITRKQKKFFELKIKGYRKDKIRMAYESLHIMELVSVQCLQVDDVIPILSPAVYCGFGRRGSLGRTTF